MEEKLKKRIPEPDTAKAFAVFAVILQHAGIDEGNAFFFMSAFQVPLFFVLSAAFGGDKLKSREKLKARSLRLLVWYICFSVIDTLMSLFVAFIKTKAFDTGELFRCLALFFSGFGISVTWFLSALIMTELIFALWLKLRRIIRIISGILVFAAFFIINNFGSLLIIWYSNSAAEDNTLSFFLCCLVSAVARLPLCLIVYGCAYFLVPRIRKIKLKAVLTPFLTIVFLAAAYLVSIINGGGSMGMVYYGLVPALYLISIFLACVAVMLLARCLCMIRINAPFAFIGANSLIILLTHMDLYLLSPAKLIAAYICKTEEGLLFFLLTLIITLIEEVPLVLIVNRYFPQLAGRGSLEKSREK